MNNASDLLYTFEGVWSKFEREVGKLKVDYIDSKPCGSNHWLTTAADHAEPAKPLLPGPGRLASC